VVVPDVEELTEGDPRAFVEANARAKARAVPAGEPVLGADTAVVLDGQGHGKPRDAAEAAGMLRALAGRTHEVMTGIALREPDGEERGEVAVTSVRFRALADADVDWYVHTREWRERAGGYAIQARGAALVESIDGDYTNVVGLPVPALLRLAPYLLQP